MDPRKFHKPSEVNNAFPIQLQGFDCCTSNRSNSNDDQIAVIPGKVIVPCISTWMERPPALCAITSFVFEEMYDLCIFPTGGPFHFIKQMLQRDVP